MAKRGYEGSKADIAADKRGMKRTGMSKKQWENSAEDKAEDAAQDRIKVKGHTRGRRQPPPPPAPSMLAPAPGEDNDGFGDME